MERNVLATAQTQNRDPGARLAFLNKAAFNLRPTARIGINMMKGVVVKEWRVRTKGYPGRAKSTCKGPGAA